MNISVLLGRVGGISLSSKPSKTFLVDVDSEGVETSHEDVDPQIKFVSVDEERVWNVFRDHARFIEIDLINVIN